MSDTQNLSYNSMELSPITRDDLLANLKEILIRQIPIFRLNVENKLVTLPHERIEHFLGESTSTETVFYIEKNWYVEKPGGAKPPQPAENNHNATQRQKIFSAVEKYGKAIEQMDNFATMSVVQREEVLDNSIEIMHTLKNQGGIFDIATIIEMVKIVANTFYANYANLNDPTETENVSQNPYGIYVKTEWIVQLIIDLFREGAGDYEKYKAIDDIATGSYTIDNMNKGLLWFIGFCLFFNDYIDKGLVTKNIRGEFREHHLRYYKKRLPDMSLSVERIVKNGLRRIDLEKELLPYSIGALLYDIGKLPFIIYHDGTDDYDESIVKMHVLTGYNMIQSARKYNFTVSAMAAFHHEYYGGKGSYNFTNPILFKVTKKKHTEDNAQYFISYEQNDFKDGSALSFFPCKMIEIVDIFNALVHKKANSSSAALKIMKKNFIAQSLKIDPILFDIFVAFKIACGVVQPSIKDELNAILY
ncbi:MAG TPA: hypothetical protein VF857_09075 [Spirochaetota bacterium]